MLSVCAYVSVCECVCMHEPPVRLCTMDVCVELRRSGGSRPDCSNPEVVVAITGRVLHNAPGCSKSCGEDGGVRGPCEPSKPHQELQRHGMKAEYAAITQNACLILLNWLCSSVRGAFKHIFFGLTRSSFTSVYVNSLLPAFWTSFHPWCEILFGMLPKFYIFSITDSLWTGFYFIMLRLKSLNLSDFIPVVLRYK